MSEENINNMFLSNIIPIIKKMIDHNDQLTLENKQLINDIKKENNRIDILIKSFNFNLGIKLNFVNELLKKNEFKCPICYDDITIENFFYFGCHIEHIHCARCVNFIEKCSLCNKNIKESIDKQYGDLKEFSLNSVDNDNIYKKIFNKN